MRKIVVVGASGGMGSAIVIELVARGAFEVVAFARSQDKLERLFGNNSSVSIVCGAVSNVDELTFAAHDAEIIFNAMGRPYTDWEKKLPPMLSNVLLAAEIANAKLVHVDNIYAYGRGAGIKVSEDFPKQPHTRKGNVRLQLENIIKASNVHYLIAHFPDFYGPHAEHTLLHQTFQSVIRNKKAVFIGSPEIPKEYIYTPDGANALVELSLRNDAYGQNWNIPGVGLITGNEILSILRSQGYSKGMTVVTKTMFRVLGMFNTGMREMLEMFYLNEQPGVLCGEKLEMELRTLSRTPFEKGILTTLGAMKASHG